MTEERKRGRKTVILYVAGVSGKTKKDMFQV